MLAAPWGGSEELWAAAALCAVKQGHAVKAFVYDWPSTPPRLTQVENAYHQRFIDKTKLQDLAAKCGEILYARYLRSVAAEPGRHMDVPAQAAR
jgi:hypothetical protein